MEGKPARGTAMALTADLVALVERVEPDPGPEPGTTEHTDAEFDDLSSSCFWNIGPKRSGSLPTAR